MRNQRKHPPYLLYGLLCVIFGLGMYLLGVMLVVPRYLVPPFGPQLDHAAEWLVWYSGVPIVLGFALIAVDLFYMIRHRKPERAVRNDTLDLSSVTVALTAYNDEDSIADAVADFIAHPAVRQVIVVSNNSIDRTFERAEAAGAMVVNEKRPGYGRCVFRCLEEALRRSDGEPIILCEGDRTFRAYDIDKLLAYAAHCDIVNGTRIVEPLRHYDTQLGSFMYYGNLFVAKLLEAKHLGRSTMTDVGTTYKLCHRAALERLMPELEPAINLEFNAHLLDVALSLDLIVVECPLTFHQRIGVSKGGNVNNWRGFAVGLRMIRGIVFDWRWAV